MKKHVIKLSLLLVTFAFFNACQDEAYLDNPEETTINDDQ